MIGEHLDNPVVKALARDTEQRYAGAAKMAGALRGVAVPLAGTRELFCADSDAPEILRLGAEELGLLRTLRNQALLAMRQA